MTTDDEKIARLERKLARGERALERKSWSASERQAASLGHKPPRKRDGDASQRQAADLLGDEGDS